MVTMVTTHHSHTSTKETKFLTKSSLSPSRQQQRTNITIALLPLAAHTNITHHEQRANTKKNGNWDYGAPSNQKNMSDGCLVRQFPLHCGHAKTCLTFAMPYVLNRGVTSLPRWLPGLFYRITENNISEGSYVNWGRLLGTL
eukprot:sb/3474164/